MADAAVSRESGKATPGVLPEWDLSDLYPGAQSGELKRDLASAAEETAAFARRYRGRLAGLAGEALAAAIAEYERISETLARVASYADLAHAGNMTDPTISRQAQDLRERVTEISSEVLFFTLEINRIEDDALARLLEAPSLARYRPWLRDVRAFRPHQLSDEAERLLHEKAVAGRTAWVRLFDETLAALRFPVAGKELNNAEALHLLSHKDEAVRREAAEALAHVLGGNLRLFGQITNTLAKDKEIEDKWRRFPTPMASRHLANHVEPEVVEALVKASRTPFRAFRTAITASRRAGSARTSSNIGTATRRCPRTTTARSHGTMRSGPCLRPTMRSRPRWRPWPAASSNAPGSMRRCGLARRRAPSVIRRCRASTHTCCSIIRERRAM